jgi:hypothetical protein
MHTIRLDISNDIFDKVMFLLENLPKNKVKLLIEESNSFEDKTFNPKNFFAVSDSSKLEIDEYLNTNKNDWNKYINER